MKGQLTLRAMGLVYTTLLALVPLLAVSFSVLKGFGVHNQIEPILLNFLAPMGERGAETTARVIEFVDNIKVGVLGSLGLALLFYTVVSLIQKIERAFNDTWRVSEQRPLAQRFSDYLSVILVGPVLVFTALGLTATISSATAVLWIMSVPVVGDLLEFLSRLLPYLLIIAAFTFIYVFVPNTKVKVRSALVGGVVAGFLWETIGWGFAAFVVSSTKYTAIYSAFATMVIFMIWLYLSWLILLIGSSIAFYHQHPEHRNLQSRVLRLSSRMKEKMALLVMTLVGQHFFQGRPGWTIDDLAKTLHVGVDACAMLVASLQRANLLVATADIPARYLPGCALETLRIKDVLASVRQAEESSNLRLDVLPKLPAVDALYNELEDAVDNNIAGRTVRDLALQDSDKITILPPSGDRRRTD